MKTESRRLADLAQKKKRRDADPEAAKVRKASYPSSKKNYNVNTDWRFYRYGISTPDFLKLLESQGGCCAICKTKVWPYKGPCVDHDHKTGKIRGILCFNCNRGLGAFKDDQELLETALKYLTME